MKYRCDVSHTLEAPNISSASLSVPNWCSAPPARAESPAQGSIGVFCIQNRLCNAPMQNTGGFEYKTRLCYLKAESLSHTSVGQGTKSRRPTFGTPNTIKAVSLVPTSRRDVSLGRTDRNQIWASRRVCLSHHRKTHPYGMRKWGGLFSTERCIPPGCNTNLPQFPQRCLTLR